jgi:hypothetical protein
MVKVKRIIIGYKLPGFPPHLETNKESLNLCMKDI